MIDHTCGHITSKQALRIVHGLIMNYTYTFISAEEKKSHQITEASIYRCNKYTAVF